MLIIRVLFMVVVVAGPLAGAARAEKSLLVVSYHAGREVWKNLGKAYEKKVADGGGEAVKITYSFGGSAKQAGAVIGGLKADVVALALPIDLDAIAQAGLLDKKWRERPGFEPGVSAYASTLVFIVRAGNPLGIKDWPDLAKPAVKVITPSPKTGGGSKLNFLNPWGYVLQKGGSEEEAKALVGKIYGNVPVLDPGARASATTFAKGIGDVFISWEAEGRLTLKELNAKSETVEIVRPGNTIVAHPPISIVDKVAEEKGTREVALDFAHFAFSKEGQEIIAKSGWRPADANVAKAHEKEFPAPESGWDVEKQFGPWGEIQKKFFADGGVFDQIYHHK